MVIDMKKLEQIFANKMFILSKDDLITLINSSAELNNILLKLE